eukprot:352049-Amphidinium_carterae.2
MTLWITHQISQIGITNGMKSRTTTARSMDYFKMTILEMTIHNRKHKFPRLTKVQYYLHKRRLKSTTLRIYSTETGANTVYKERANHNIINEVD